MYFDDDEEQTMGGQPAAQGFGPGFQGMGGQQQQQGAGAPSMITPGMKLMLMGQVMQGHDPFKAMSALAQMRQAEAKMQAEQTYMQGLQQAGQQGQAGVGAPGGPGGPGGAPGAPGMAPQMDPATAARKAEAQRYRGWAQWAGSRGRDQAAKRYMDMAMALDPVVAEEWSQPVTELDPQSKQPVVVQYSKQGQRRVVDGAMPKRDLTAPVAGANGMFTMDQNSGQVQNLGVQPHEGRSTDQKEYEQAVQQGYKGTLQQWLTAMANAKAPRTTVTMSPVIKTANSLGENVAEGVAKDAVKNVQGGAAAGQALANVQTVRDNLPEAITGPLAAVRTWTKRAASEIGIGNYKQQLASTQRMVQGLARMSLDGAAMMEGQGQITQPERELLTKASSAAQELNRDEIAAATELVERIQRFKLQQAHTSGQAILNNPDLAPVHPHIRGSLSQVPQADQVITPSTAQPPKGRSASGPVTQAGKTVKRTGKTADGRTVVEYTDGTREFR